MSEITPETIFRVAELHRTIKEQADEIERLRAENERLKAYTDAYNTLLAERVEVECLRGLAIRAWHSFRSGLSATGGCLDGLTDGDILELVRLSNTEAAKNLERDVLRDCQQGNQRCHECPDVQCADNMSDATELTRLRAENADLRLQLIDAGVWEEEHPPT